MKRGTTAKIKFKRLQRRLDLTLYEARGLLDCLWDAAYDNAPAGDIGRLTNEDIATLVDWRGDADDLIAALIECGWLDEDPDKFRLVIHEWSEHCEGWHVGNFAKHGKRFADLDLADRRRESTVAKQTTKQHANEPAKHAAPSLSLSFPLSPSPSASEALACADPPKAADGEPPPVGKPKRERAPRPGDPLWDAIMLIFHPSGLPSAHRSRIGKAVKSLLELNATPEELKRRYENARHNWPGYTITVESIIRNWDQLNERGGTTRNGTTHDQAALRRNQKRADTYAREGPLPILNPGGT